MNQPGTVNADCQDPGTQRCLPRPGLGQGWGACRVLGAGGLGDISQEARGLCPENVKAVRGEWQASNHSLQTNFLCVALSIFAQEFSKGTLPSEI